MTAAYRTHLEHWLATSDVPAHLHSGLVHYIGDRRPVGGFLTAVLSNDLKEAVARAADPATQASLPRIVFFLYNHAPGPCWGSAADVEAWLADSEPPPETFE